MALPVHFLESQEGSGGHASWQEGAGGYASWHLLHHDRRVQGIGYNDGRVQGMTGVTPGVRGNSTQLADRPCIFEWRLFHTDCTQITYV